MTDELERTREDHCTPVWLLELIRGVAPIGLDPCSNPWSKVDAAESYSRHNGQDGLTLPWGGKGLVFVNPPYSRGEIMKWVSRANDEIVMEDQLIMLVPAAPDTHWFRLAWSGCDAVCFLKKRIAFEGAYPAGAKQPSSLIYWGAKADGFCRHFYWHGIVLQREHQGVLCA